MSRLRLHPESHLVGRIGWLRAAVLGANDGIVSTASLIVGVAAAAATQNDVLIAGVAGLVAGAMSMAAGEYVSVSSQSDTEQADLARERKELSENAGVRARRACRYLRQARCRSGAGAAGCPATDGKRCPGRPRARRAWHFGNHHRASCPGRADVGRNVFRRRGHAVAHGGRSRRPSLLVPLVSAASLGFLALLGAIGARAGGANLLRATARVTFWGALAMALTAGIGKLFGTVI